MYIIGKYKTDL